MPSWPKGDDGQYLSRADAKRFIALNGSQDIPPQPRSVVAQSGSRKVLVTWELPEANFDQIAGWKVFTDNENSLLATIKDPNVRQYDVAASAGSSPPTKNIFVASISKAGVQSNPVQVQGTATAEAGAPTDPSPPAGSAASGDTGASGDSSSGFIEVSSGGSRLPK